MAEENKNVEPVEEPKNGEESRDKKPEKVFTQDEVNQIIADRLKRQKDKLEKAAEEERKKQEEAEKLKKMSEDDRNAFELKKAKEELATAQKQINRYKMKQQASEMLGEQGIQLSEAQLDLVVSDDAEATLGKVKDLTSIIADQKEKQRQQMLAGKTPSVAGANKDELKSKIDGIKDPYLRREEMLKHPELYLN